MDKIKLSYVYFAGIVLISISIAIDGGLAGGLTMLGIGLVFYAIIQGIMKGIHDGTIS